jgi:putative lipoic acid-binding regulatory protein
MDSGPSLELLVATHQFPGKYVFKVIGHPVDDFPGRVVAVVRSELQQSFDAPFQIRETASGRHVSVTIEPWIDAPEQVLAIYGRLKTEVGLVMLL